MVTPHDILTAYSTGHIASSNVMRMLHMDSFRDLLNAMNEARLPFSKPPKDEVDEMVRVALPILAQALNEQMEISARFGINYA